MTAPPERRTTLSELADRRRITKQAGVALVRLARDLPVLEQVLADSQLGYPAGRGTDGGRCSGHSDPAGELGAAIGDWGPNSRPVPDNARDDLYSLRLTLRRIAQLEQHATRIYARWLPHLAHVEACANPYGCPDQMPAATQPRRRGLCNRCYSYQLRHDGRHRRDAKIAA